MSGPARQCLDCGSIGTWGRSGRCDDCAETRSRRKEADPRRRAIKRTRYDNAHRRLRDEWKPIVATGSVNCARCGEPIVPHRGQAWDLDHTPGGSLPSHARCNRAAITRPA
jgi:hypothetical protein